MRAVASAGARLPKPYYEADGQVIYHGDCREILPSLSYFPCCDYGDVLVGQVGRSDGTLFSDGAT